MSIASAIFLRPDIRGPRSISVQQKLPWLCTSDDDRGAWQYGRAACHGNGQARRLWDGLVTVCQQSDRTH
jgi:hypothetical protein